MINSDKQVQKKKVKVRSFERKQFLLINLMQIIAAENEFNSDDYF